MAIDARRHWPVVARWTSAAIIGVALGAGSAVFALKSQQLASVETRDGSWSTSLDKGDVDANAYVRGLSALRGLLAMSAQETVYYTAETDSDGRRLSEGCDYELTGGGQPARWWSITVYDDADFLASNTDDHHSVDATRMVRGPDGQWSVRLAREAGKAANWLSAAATRRPVLSLRLYNPEPSVLAAPAGLPAPIIRRIRCVGDRQ